MMFFFLNNLSSFDNIMQLIKFLVILVLVLFACFYVTKWLGKSGIIAGTTKNFTPIETYRIAQNKYLQIVKVGEKYLVLGLTKDHIEYLTELSEAEIVLNTLEGKNAPSFKDILSKLNKKQLDDNDVDKNHKEE